MVKFMASGRWKVHLLVYFLMKFRWQEPLSGWITGSKSCLSSIFLYEIHIITAQLIIHKWMIFWPQRYNICYINRLIKVQFSSYKSIIYLYKWMTNVWCSHYKNIIYLTLFFVLTFFLAVLLFTSDLLVPLLDFSVMVRQWPEQLSVM